MGNSHNVLTADPADTLATSADCERLFAQVLADVVGAEHVSVDDHFFDDLGADSMLMARFCARVRKRADLPSVSMPDIYQHPTIRSLATALAGDVLIADVPAGTGPADCERLFAQVLADVVGTEHVSVDGHFFDDLGADSMLMARFCARVRKRADLPSVSMPDVYQHPTIRSLAAALAEHQNRHQTRACRAAGNSGGSHRAAEAGPQAVSTSSAGRCSSCSSSATPPLTAIVAVKGYEWVSAGPNLVDIYLRSVAFGGAMFLGLCTLPILLKWVLDRPVEAAADPRLEHGVPPLLARQDPGPAEPDGAVRRFTALRALPEGAGREGRARRRHPVQARARVHRPAHASATAR